jgi:hypothetical protein
LSETYNPEQLTRENAQKFCTQRGLDYIIRSFILIDDAEEDRVLIKTEVFDYKSNKWLDVEESDGLGRIFILIGQAVGSAIGAVTGEDYTTGSISFMNKTGIKGKYSVSIDNIYVGDNLEDLHYVLSGKRNIKLYQSRLGGKRYWLVDIDADINPGSRTGVEFAIPELLESEQNTIKDSEIFIDKYLNSKYMSYRVQNSFNRLLALLEDVSFSEAAQKKKDSITGKYAAWKQNMADWNLEKGITVADMPFGFGIKATALNSYIYLEEKEGILADSKTDKALGWGAGLFMTFDITPFMGLQTEFLVNNQKTALYYDNVLNPALRTEFSMWFMEMPLILYFKIPSYLFKFYGGVSYKHRIANMGTNIEDETANTLTTSEYKKTNLRMRNSSWFAGLITEVPVSSNSTILFDFRYNKDLYSWFPQWADEKDILAGYLSFSLGYSLKSESLKNKDK